MNKARLEAFSDGVFAIVVTLLVLDIRIPKTDYDHLLPALVSIIPQLLAYAFSFIITGIYWVSHHNISRLMSHVDNTMIWLNIFLLIFIAFIPFPTSLIATYPLKQLPVILYTSTLLITNFIGFIIWRYVSVGHRLLVPDAPAHEIHRINKSFLVVNLTYLAAIALSFAHIYASYALLIYVVVYIIFFPSTWRIKK